MENKKILIRILIGKEEEKIHIDKKLMKSFEETLDRIKPTLDRLSKKETTDEDWLKFIILIKQNIIKHILKKVNSIITNVELDMKESQKLAKEENEDSKYYEGHWVGMDAVRVDYLLSLKEELEKDAI